MFSLIVEIIIALTMECNLFIAIVAFHDKKHDLRKDKATVRVYLTSAIGLMFMLSSNQLISVFGVVVECLSFLTNYHYKKILSSSN